MDYTVYILISTADRCNIWRNCAFNDKSVKFFTQSGYVIRKIFGYRDIADCSCEKIASHFSNRHQRFR